jgi:hypothetical protein
MPKSLNQKYLDAQEFAAPLFLHKILVRFLFLNQYKAHYKVKNNSNDQNRLNYKLN